LEKTKKKKGTELLWPWVFLKQLTHVGITSMGAAAVLTEVFQSWV
jgi:hypothetical protein